MTCRPPAPAWQGRSRQGPSPARCSGSAKGGASRPCGPVRCANHGSAPVLHPRSLGGFPSSVQREQILLVARDQFRIAVAAGDLIVTHRSPIAGGGKLVQLVKALLVMRVRRRGSEYDITQSVNRSAKSTPPYAATMLITASPNFAARQGELRSVGTVSAQRGQNRA